MLGGIGSPWSPLLGLCQQLDHTGPAAIAIGKLNTNQTSYYVRREDHKDTVLVARYTLDDLIKLANGLTQPS